MKGKKTKGRQKIEMKRIEDEDDRLVTFSKRRYGIYKKASELVTMCGAKVGILVFSPTEKPFSYGHPSLESIANHFLNQNLPPNDNTHPLVEAHRRVKIHELNQQHNELHNRLEVEQEREKILKQITKTNQGQGWWKAHIEEFGLQELQQMNASMEDLHKKLRNRINKLTIVASSSFPPKNPTQPTNPLITNITETKSSIPHGFRYGRGFF